MHMSLRLAWHNDGWNGNICRNPNNNTYCIGQHSYPGTRILENRNIKYEEEHAGERISCQSCDIPCALSANAFGKENIKTKMEIPGFWKEGDAEATDIEIPPYTACTWPYEVVYKGDIYFDNGKYDYDKRFEKVKKYFSQFEEKKSLIFYTTGYSNPFSENEENNYIIVGISRIKKMNEYQYYENATEETKEKYANALIWQRPITSTYPEEGFVIPYWKYRNKEEILNKIVLKPINKAPFKYGTREVHDDDALNVVYELIKIVDVLIEIKDDTQDWKERKKWLNGLIAELWKARGPYPGLISTLSNLGLNELIVTYSKITNEEEIKNFKEQIKDLLEGKIDEIFGTSIDDLPRIRRNFKLMDEDVQTLLLEILPRFDLTSEQVKSIISEKRQDVSIVATAKEMVENPYIIFEQYNGKDSEDIIPFYKIDNGIIVSPEYGIKKMLEVDSAERFRAMCVDELNKIPAHSFGKAEKILEEINYRLERMPEWKKATYKLKNFEVDKDILREALAIRKDENDEIYLYLKNVYEDERVIQEVLQELVNRPDIQIKMTINEEKFKEKLRIKESKLNDKEEYEKILENQAQICMQLFTKPICVLSGAAGTGKTTVIKSIVENIEHVHGQGSSFLIMAPTGKASERIKNQTGKNSCTIHSHLAKNGWINSNLTLKRTGGRNNVDVNTIIIDECSMIDLNLFATLLRSINWNNVQRLILVGDPNQLPPIGRGKVFADIIEWLEREHKSNIGILTDNIRQLANRIEGNGCGILELAELFIQEKQGSHNGKDNREELKQKKDILFEKILEKGNGDVDKDLGVYFWKNQEELELILTDAIRKDMKKLVSDSEEGKDNELWEKVITDEQHRYKPEIIQIISPYKGEYYGTYALNQLLQSNFNQENCEKFQSIDGINYFDKVIQIRNRPQSDKAYVYNWEAKKIEQEEIYNGEIGIVEKPRGKEWYGKKIKNIQVKFSNKSRKDLSYKYGKRQELYNGKFYIKEQKVIDNLELAYVISVHKSQGSEFDYVYIIMPKRDSHLLSMELLYTAITRAQKKVVIFMQEDIGTLNELTKIEKSAVRKINSSVFKFEPLPEEILYISNWYEKGKNISTISEYFVRSKSEAIIANMLKERNIEFKYEEPLYAKDGTMYLPDFTVIFRGETYYWEHVGMLDKPDYKKHWEKKKAWYDRNFSNKLIVTYEGKNLSIDAKNIIDSYQ